MQISTQTLFGLSILGISISLSHAATISEKTVAKMPNGDNIKEYTLSNKNGMTVKILDVGAVIAQVIVPDHEAKLGNVVLGFANPADYATLNKSNFGAVVGRYANRIAKGQFTINDKTYQLPINNGENSLHGGSPTFAQDLWQSKIVKSKQKDTAAVELKYLSPNGQNGFPGNLTTTLVYSLNDANELALHYTAKTDQDTVINLTNHSYFNLAGETSGTVEDQEVQLLASHFTRTDAASIPTGEITLVADTPMDFRNMKPIGQNIRDQYDQLQNAKGYDHNWVLDNYKPNATQPALAAKAFDPKTKRTLEVYTTQPGIQFFTANGFNGTVIGTSGKAYRSTDAFALETQHFPNSPNTPNFPSTLLKKGQTFNETTIYKFGVK